MSANNHKAVILGSKKLDKPPDPATIKFEPMWDYALMWLMPKEATKGGLVLADNVKSIDDVARFIVIKAGPGTYRDNGTWVKNPLQQGDVVYAMGMMRPFEYVEDGVGMFVVSGRDCVGTNRKMTREDLCDRSA